jgi:hypothetical protein
VLRPYPPGNFSTSYSKARQARNWLSESSDYFYPPNMFSTSYSKATQTRNGLSNDLKRIPNSACDNALYEVFTRSLKFVTVCLLTQAAEPCTPDVFKNGSFTCLKMLG